MNDERWRRSAGLVISSGAERQQVDGLPGRVGELGGDTGLPQLRRSLFPLPIQLGPYG